MREVFGERRLVEFLGDGSRKDQGEFERGRGGSGGGGGLRREKVVSIGLGGDKHWVR